MLLERAMLLERFGRLPPIVYGISTVRSKFAVHQVPPLHLVCTKFVNTISMPFGSVRYVKKVSFVGLPTNLTSGPAPTTLPEEVLRHRLPARPSLLSGEAVGPLRLTPVAVNIVCGRGVSYLSPRRGGHEVHSSPNRYRQPEHHERDNNQ